MELIKSKSQVDCKDDEIYFISTNLDPELREAEGLAYNNKNGGGVTACCSSCCCQSACTTK